MITISQKLKLPDNAVTQTFGFMARRGAGKTYTAGKLVEGLLDIGTQVVVVDPIGNWYGLRISSDGKSPGYPIPVIGGIKGDVPIEPEAGELIANLVADKNLSCVIDISQFSLEGRRKFYTAFATQLFQRKKADPRAIHLVFEEAQLFAPQKCQKGEEAMLHISEQIVRLGRNYGIGASLISQRPQSVNKEVLNQVECLFVLQTNGVHERKAIKDWISYQGFDADLVAELPQLPIGEAYVWSPQWLRLCARFKIGKKKTFDASATPTFNCKTVAPRKLEKLEMSAIQDAMSDIVEKKKANDPRLLKKEIQKLKSQLGSGNRASPEEIKEAVDKAIMEDRQRWEKVLDRYHKRVMFHFDAAKNEPLRPPDKRGFFPKDKKTTQSIPKIIPQKSRVEVDSDIELPKGARRMAEELVAIHPRIVNKKQLATIVGMKSTGGTFSNYMSILRKGGFLHENGNGMFCASEMARETFDSVEAVPTTHDGIVSFWKGKIPAGAFRILNILIEHYDCSLTKQEIAEQVDMAFTGGTFSNYLTILVTNGLADRVGPGELKASENIFPG